MKKQRAVGIDLIKLCAILFVISIHQIGNTNVLATPVGGKRMFLILSFRYLVMACVPLLLMITGYLQNKKRAEKSFYKGIFPVLADYLLISILCLLCRISVNAAPRDLPQNIISIFNFTANDYAWYVEMYIGLFLLIPFLNGMYHAIETKSRKLLFLGILIFLTIAPSFGYLFNSETYYFDVFPDFWQNIYPLTYYFVGAFIKEYQPKLSAVTNIFLLVLCIVFPVGIQYMFFAGEEFHANIFNGFYSASAFAISVLLFLLLYRRDMPGVLVKSLISRVAAWSLSIYLFSRPVELLLYPKIPQAFPNRLLFCIVAVFLLSVACSACKVFLFWIVKISCKKIHVFCQRNKTC